MPASQAHQASTIPRAPFTTTHLNQPINNRQLPLKLDLSNSFPQKGEEAFHAIDHTAHLKWKGTTVPRYGPDPATLSAVNFLISARAEV
jgi:hypothetical protein